MDISKTTEPRSDQLNYDDVATYSVTATISEVRAGTSEQPVEIHLEGFGGRPYKPSKSMRRVLVAAWGKHAEEYVGRVLSLYGDPSVKWAGEAVGGIRIKAMSHIEKPLSVPLTVSRGKRQAFTVQPLQDAPQPAQPDPIEQSLNDAWDDTERLQKAVQWLSDQGHPLHQKAADRLAELEGETS